MRKLVVILIIILGIVGILLYAYRSNGSDTPSATATNSNTAVQKTTYDESQLINHGVTSEQLGSLEQALGQYMNSQGEQPDKVSFASIKRVPTDPNTTTPFSEITFAVALDSKTTYLAKMDSFSPSEIRLYLYGPDGKTQLYDSQNIGGSSGQ